MVGVGNERVKKERNDANAGGGGRWASGSIRVGGEREFEQKSLTL